MFVPRGSRTARGRKGGVSGTQRKRARGVRGDPACLGAPAPVGSEARSTSPGAGDPPQAPWYACFQCSLPPPPKMGNGEKRKAEHRELRQVNSATSQAPAREGRRGPGAGRAGRRGPAGWGGREGEGRCRRGAWRCGRSRERFPPAAPGRTRALQARASSRPSQAPGRRRGRGRGCGGARAAARAQEEATCLSPRARRAGLAAPGWRPRPPRLPGTSRGSLLPARLAPARAPEGRYLGAPAPGSLPAANGALLQLPRPTSASAEGEGRGRREHRNRSFLRRSPPAGIAAGGARARRSAAQRSGGAGALASRRAPRAGTPPSPPLPVSPLRGRPAGDPSQQDPGTQGREGPMASPCLGRVRDGGSESPLYSLGSFLDPHLLGCPPLGSTAQGDPAPALPQVFHVSIEFASQ